MKKIGGFEFRHFQKLSSYLNFVNFIFRTNILVDFQITMEFYENEIFEKKKLIVGVGYMFY